MTTLVRSLQLWLVFGGAGFVAMKLAGRCGDPMVPRSAMALLAPLAVILPVGVVLIAVYRRSHEMNIWGAMARAVLMVLLGAAFAALFYSCER